MAYLMSVSKEIGYPFREPQDDENQYQESDTNILFVKG